MRLVLGPAVVLLQGLRDAQVHRLARMQTHRVVDHVAGDAVLEPEGAGGFAGKDEVLLGQRSHQRMVFGAAAQLLQQPRRDDVADHRGRAHQFGLRVGQPRDARLDQHVQPGGTAVQAHQPRVDVFMRRRVAQLLDEQRVASGVAADLGADERVGPGKQRADRLRGFVLRERRKFDHLHVVHRRVAGLEPPGRQQDEQWRTLECANRRQRLLRRCVRPLPVVDEQHQKLGGHQAGEHGLHRGHRGLGRGALGICARLGRDGQGSQQLGPVRLQTDPGQVAHHAVGGLVGRHGMRQAEHSPQHLQHRLQRLRAEVALAIASENSTAPCCGERQKVLRQTRLAHAGRCRDRHMAWRSGQGVGQEAVERPEFGLPADERRQAATRARLEPRAHQGAAHDGVGADGFHAPQHRNQPPRAGLEEVTFRAECFFADQDFVPRGGIGQA